jgi:hypothetical protein
LQLRNRKPDGSRHVVVQRRTSDAAARNSVNPAGTVRKGVVATGDLSRPGIWNQRGLGKICSRFDIPVPPRGYWAKLAAGKHVTRIPFPTAKSDVSSEILIQPSPEGPEAALPEQVRAEVTAVLETRDQIQVPETLRSPHPIVKRWLEQFAAGDFAPADQVR